MGFSVLVIAFVDIAVGKLLDTSSMRFSVLDIAFVDSAVGRLYGTSTTSISVLEIALVDRAVGLGLLATPFQFLVLRQRHTIPLQIKICFQTMLSPDFVLGKNLSLYIAMGQPVSDFETPIVTMFPVSNVFENFHIFKGVLILPKAFKGQNIAYKYVVNKSEIIQWENLPNEHMVWHSKAIVNRCLNVPKDAKDVYEKYDEVIWKTPSTTFQEKKERDLWRSKAMLEMFPKRADLKKDLISTIKNAIVVKRALGNSKDDDQRLLEVGKKTPFRRPFDFRQERELTDSLNKEFEFIEDRDDETYIDKLKCCILQLCLLRTRFNDDVNSFSLFMAFIKREDSRIEFDAHFGAIKEKRKLWIANEIFSLTERFCESKVPFKIKQQLWIYSLPLIHWLGGEETATLLPKCRLNLSGQSWNDMAEILKTDELFSYTFVRVFDSKTCFDKLLDNDPICEYPNGFGCHLFERLLFSAKDGLPRERIGEDYAYKAMLKLLEVNINEREQYFWIFQSTFAHFWRENSNFLKKSQCFQITKNVSFTTLQ